MLLNEKVNGSIKSIRHHPLGTMNVHTVDVVAQHVELFMLPKELSPSFNMKAIKRYYTKTKNVNLYNGA